MIKYLFAVFILTFTNAAIAQDKLDTTKYSPNYCQFTAAFPEEPYITQRCDGDKKDTCYNLISYTKVFDMRSSINVEIICNQSTPAMYKEFTPKVMEATVRAMTKGTVIEEYEIKVREEENFRQAGLLGKGRRGLDDTIYIAQLWIADKSIMSVEAELIGEQSEKADKLFAEILRNIGYTKEMSVDEESSDEKTKPQ